MMLERLDKKGAYINVFTKEFSKKVPNINDKSFDFITKSHA